MSDAIPRENRLTEITITGGLPSGEGANYATAMNRTWQRSEGEGLATFQARVRSEALALGADCIVWGGLPEHDEE